MISQIGISIKPDILLIPKGSDEVKKQKDNNYRLLSFNWLFIRVVIIIKLKTV